jgi:hypothetical protein
VTDVTDNSIQVSGEITGAPGTYIVNLYEVRPTTPLFQILVVEDLGLTFRVSIPQGSTTATFTHKFTDVHWYDLKAASAGNLGLTVTEVSDALRQADEAPAVEVLKRTSELSMSASIPGATVSGRVTTPAGTGLRNAIVSLIDPATGTRRTASTSSFGLYTFDDVSAFRYYTMSISSKRYRFAPQNVYPNGNLASIDFVGLE